MHSTQAPTHPRHGTGQSASPKALDTIPLAQLLLICGEQLDCFRRGGESDPHFGLELFRRAIDARDHGAWRGVVELYRPLLLARLKRDGLAWEMAEEAVQEAFVALWLKSAAGLFSTHKRTLPEVLNYLLGSVRFARIKLQRQQRDVPLVIDEEAAHPLADSMSAVEQTLDARTLISRVRTQVSPYEWQILWLRFGREMPPRAIAALTGVPVEEIHTMLASAKRRLRNDPQLRHIANSDAAEKSYAAASIDR